MRTTMFCVQGIWAILAIFITLCHAKSGSNNQNCMQIADGSPANLMGGWREHDLSKELDEFKRSVAGIADKVLDEHNKMSNDMCQYELMQGGRFRVYTQVVSGTNYCIQFIGKASNIKSGSSNDICATKAVKCVSQIYQPLSGPQRIDELECH